MQRYQVIGLMSGTSLDGVDLAYVEFVRNDGQWEFEVSAAETINYDSGWRSRLQEAVGCPAVDLLVLNNEYGRWLGELVADFVKRHKISGLDFVSSHGHTIFHQIDKGLTYQVGSGYHLSAASGCCVIADFRSLDVTLGGQGAPFVPIADELLFSAYDFCLNLGGIANVSYRHGGARLAFDIGLSNMLLNHLTLARGIEYDKGGQLARSGQKNEEFFKSLNELSYFQLPSPKSTGYEWFVDEVLPVAKRFGNLSLEDALCTVVHHVAFQVAQSINAIGMEGRILVTGGGAKNNFMMDLIRQYAASGLKVVIPEPHIVDFKEAIAFALMGVLRMEGEVNCFSSVTGASRDSCGGVLYEAVVAGQGKS